jgi:hypothetical protein
MKRVMKNVLAILCVRQEMKEECLASTLLDEVMRKYFSRHMITQRGAVKVFCDHVIRK